MRVRTSNGCLRLLCARVRARVMTFAAEVQRKKQQGLACPSQGARLEESRGKHTIGDWHLGRTISRIGSLSS